MTQAPLICQVCGKVKPCGARHWSVPEITEEQLTNLEMRAWTATPGPWGCRQMSAFDDLGMRTVISGAKGEPIYWEDKNLFFVATANPEIVLALINKVRGQESTILELTQRAQKLEARIEGFEQAGKVEALINGCRHSFVINERCVICHAWLGPQP